MADPFGFRFRHILEEARTFDNQSFLQFDIVRAMRTRVTNWQPTEQQWQEFWAVLEKRWSQPGKVMLP